VLHRGVCLLALGIPLLIGCGSGGNPNDLTPLGNSQGVTRQIAGEWSGKLHQKGLPPFKVAVKITPSGGGQVAYTGIRCGGKWTLSEVASSIPPQYRFTEKITQGASSKCKGKGIVSLLPIQGFSPNEPAYKRMNYSFSGGGVSSRGLLHRVHAGAEAAVFRQAGVAQS
jgi:hypothetical protein